MLTLESKFSDYVEALRKAGACEPVVAIHDKMVKKNPDLTVGDVYKTFYDDPSLEQGWAYWVLELMGKELDLKIREIAINKLKDPMLCLQLLTKCDFLTEAEHILLKAKYAGKLPTAEKEIRDVVVVLKATAEVAP